MIIALAGRAGSGKTTAARFLKAHYMNKGHEVEVLSFASPIKRLIAEITGCEESNLSLESVKQTKIPSVFARTYYEVYNENGDYLAKCLTKEDAETEVAFYKGLLETEVHYIEQEQLETYRELLQFIGTELLVRQFSENVWVQALINKCVHDDTIYIVDDLRFPAEYDALLDKDAAIVRLEKNLMAPITHESEAYISSFVNCVAFVKNEEMERLEFLTKLKSDVILLLDNKLKL